MCSAVKRDLQIVYMEEFKEFLATILALRPKTSKRCFLQDGHCELSLEGGEKFEERLQERDALEL